MTPNQKIIFDELFAKYRKITLTKREVANELGLISIQGLDKRIKLNQYVPKHKVINNKVFFNLVDVSEFIAVG